MQHNNGGDDSNSSEDWIDSSYESDLSDSECNLVTKSENEDDQPEFNPSRAHEWVFEEDKEELEYIFRVYKYGVQ